MRNTLILVSATIFATSCGVNPDRLATIQARQAQAAEKKTSEKKTADDKGGEAVVAAVEVDPEDEKADVPPEPEDLTKTTMGCGFYPVSVEAKQTAPNQFGDNLITSAYVADANPGNATRIDCALIPPITDAPADIISVMKEFVAWLEPADVISMEGNFQYQAGDDGQLTRVGTARVYRRNAALGTNKCGGEAGKLTCAAEGSKLAGAIDLAKHYMTRADVYRKKGNVDRCKKMSDLANKATNVSSSEDTALLFKLASGHELSHAETVEKLGQFKRQSETALRGDWCSTK